MLPSELLSKLDLGSLRLVPGSYVEAELGSSQSDLLFAVEIRKKPGLIYLLFEHQSHVDALMPFRLLKYVVRILDQHIAVSGGRAKALPLPAVIPVVLHHSTTGWTASTSMEDLFDADLVSYPGIAVHIPRLSFVLDDISRLSDEELTLRALGLVPTLTLWALRDARHSGQVQRAIGRWSSTIQALSRAEDGGEALLTIFRYLSLVVDELTPQTLFTALAPPPTETKETLMTTLAERWKAEGEAKGRVEGARKALLQLVSLKFGQLSNADRQRIEAASEEQLLGWTARVLSSESLAVVLSE